MQPLNLRSIPLGELLLRRRALRRQLLTRTDLTDLRIAVLGGTTTNELVDLLEILLLDGGFRPAFYQSEYGRYYGTLSWNLKLSQRSNRILSTSTHV